jgi:rubrerythrin
VNFDIDRYLRVVAPLDDRDIDYDAFRDEPLDADALRTLRYMHDVEGHTVCYQRDLLVTRAHDDPTLTTFLTMWAYEEHWHGEAIGKILAAHGEPFGDARIAAMRSSQKMRDRMGTLATALTSMASRHMTAVHMCWGAVNEWTTQAGYLRLADRAQHPVLATLVRRIARQEGRHIDFYASQAEMRLAHPLAQRLARWALAHRWAPVGSGIMPRDETAHVVRYLFAGDAGAAMAQRIDERIHRLPGLAGLHLVANARREYAAA